MTTSSNFTASGIIDNDALKYILSIPRGRAVIWDLLTAYGLYRNAHSVETAEREFHLGMHNAALILYAECMAVSPDLTAMMIREQGDYDNAGTSSPARPERPTASDDNPGLGYSRGYTTDLGDSASGD
jgi:hypothetical protein